jgi:putative transposase
VPRRNLRGSAGVVFNLLNRSIRGSRIFRSDLDYRCFIVTLRDAQRKVPIEVLAYCVMPTHFHLVVRPRTDDQLRQFAWWLTGTHTKRWHAAHATSGTGPIYQGRYKAIRVSGRWHFLELCRYVESNPRRGRLVSRSEDWRWSSLGQRCRNLNDVELEPWPFPQPADWLEIVNR